ncbi:MAG: ABC transporter ATP-binding protein [Xanthomonadaceae bacterium]|nr:ABC transporter ATP-binding protein [Xanthomonadaceae bacterium]
MGSLMVLVSVEQLYRNYGEHRAVVDLSFELRRGEVLGLLGPNGAGKSSTMSILSGNLAPSSGRVTIAGFDILDQPNEAKARIGYLPEVPPVHTDLTVDEYLDYAAGLHRVPRRARRGAREAAKSRCGLSDSGRRLIGNLSKGYRQRVGIAQAIIHNPPVVILDEPTVGLDPIQVREIRALIGELGKEHSVILSTHILPEVLATCTHVKIIHHGRLVFSEDIAHLDDRLRDTAFVVDAGPAADADAFAAIAGVLTVDTLGPGRFRIHHAANASPAPEVAQLAVARGWPLNELSPERRTLEQVFVDLTTADVGAP